MVVSLIEKLIVGDPIVRHLLERSALTRVQADTYHIYRSLFEMGRSSLEEMVELREGGSVSKGSFSRTLGQARGNVRRSLFTILLLEYLLLMPEGTALALDRAGRALREVRGKKIGVEEMRVVLNSVDDLVEGITKLHGRRL